jgi:hypothetical protein
VWANNADTISSQYTGTGALKTDFTRTGKRTLKGALNDGLNSITRYYLNNFSDGFRQVHKFEKIIVAQKSHYSNTFSN